MSEQVRAGTRVLLVQAAAVAALAHVPVVAPHLAEAPYMGVLFVLFIAGCSAVGVLALVRPGRAVYQSAVLVCGAAVAAYAATRLVAFPQLADDVGSWFEPLGVLSVVSESLVVGCSLLLLRPARSPALATAPSRLRP